MSEFEAEVADVVNPSPFSAVHGVENNGLRIIELMNELLDLLSEDCAKAFNNHGYPIVQYLLSNGVGITAGCSAHTMGIDVQLPADLGKQFITYVERDADGTS